MNMRLYTPGILELYVGPMYSGKTQMLALRLDRFQHQSNYGYIAFKPRVDNRHEGDITKTRYNNISLDTVVLDSDNPGKILEMDLPRVVAFDEMQFFDDSIVDAVVTLMRKDYHVIGTALDLDFRGELFGPVGRLMANANDVYKLTAVCHSCGSEGTRTQRLINGSPASYNEPIVRIEGKDSKETYECRCLDCHIVPR
ncbi:MAG: thymidine kinase [Candidatus Woesearchaeota archaeon]